MKIEYWEAPLRRRAPGWSRSATCPEGVRPGTVTDRMPLDGSQPTGDRWQGLQPHHPLESSQYSIAWPTIYDKVKNLRVEVQFGDMIGHWYRFVWEVTSGQKAPFVDILEGIASPATTDPRQQFPPDKLPLCVHQRHSLAAPVTPRLGWMHR